MERPFEFLSIFSDPMEYDSMNFDVLDDINFYIELVEKYGTPVLEMGCGTGRITIPIRGRGWDIVGLDLSFPMVRRAVDKALSMGLSLHCFVGDMRRFSLRRRFPLIIVPFNAFSHIYTFEDIRNFFENAREHLLPDGILIIDVFNPDVDMLKGSSVKRLVSRYRDREGHLVEVYGTNFYDSATQVNYIRWYFVRGDVEWSREFTMRVFFPQELENYARLMGFHIFQKYGDYDFSTFSSTSRRQILLLTPHGGGAY